MKKHNFSNSSSSTNDTNKSNAFSSSSLSIQEKQKQLLTLQRQRRNQQKKQKRPSRQPTVTVSLESIVAKLFGTLCLILLISTMLMHQSVTILDEQTIHHGMENNIVSPKSSLQKHSLRMKQQQQPQQLPHITVEKTAASSIEKSKIHDNETKAQAITYGDFSPQYTKLRQKMDELILPPMTEKVIEERKERIYQNLHTYGSGHPSIDDEPQCPPTPSPDYPQEWNLMDVLHKWNPDDVDTASTSNNKENRRRSIYRGICIFDYESEYDKALAYRAAEKPFVIRNDPYVYWTTERWNHEGYMRKLLSLDQPQQNNGGVNINDKKKEKEYRAEYSENNHFMYWMLQRNQKKVYKQRKKNTSTKDGGTNTQKRQKESIGRGAITANRFMQKLQNEQKKEPLPAGWEAPTKMIHMNFDNWYRRAKEQDLRKQTPTRHDQKQQQEQSNNTNADVTNATKSQQQDVPHWYFRLIGCGAMGKCDGDRSTESLFSEMDFFHPQRPQSDLYLGSEKDKQSGIHCRFGMSGVISEAHYDGSRNMIALLSGERRYILSHPNQCQNLYLYPKSHPSSRHSEIDWSNVPNKKGNASTVSAEEASFHERFPKFANATANEIVLQAGDVLYLPTNWFHYIVSLNMNYQCNTRSGTSFENDYLIQQCGF